MRDYSLEKAGAPTEWGTRKAANARTKIPVTAGDALAGRGGFVAAWGAGPEVLGRRLRTGEGSAGGGDAQGGRRAGQG